MITSTITLKFPKWNIKEEFGYEPKTTFGEDFSIADKFGKSAIQDTYNRAFKEWKTKYVYLTELILVLNHKIWQWHKTNKDIALLYNTLWEQTSIYAENNLKGKELEYYYQVTD